MARDRGESTVTIFLDFRKAFNTVNHSILIEKLIKSGLGRNTVTMLKNYLTKRKQSTLLNNIRSEVQEVCTGVPQGSTLGPLLFLLYIDDLPLVLEHGSDNILFADDTII